MQKFIYSKHTKIIAVLLFIASIVLGALTFANGIAKYCSEGERIYKFESDFSQTSHFSSLLVAPESAIVNAYYDLSEISAPEAEASEFDSVSTAPHTRGESDAEIRVVLKPVTIEKAAVPDEITIIESEAPQNEVKLIPLRPLERKITADKETRQQHLVEKLDNLYCADKINYYVKWNDTVLTNCGANSEKELMNAQFYRFAKQDERGFIEIESSQNAYQSYSVLEQLSQYDTADSMIVCTSVKEGYVAECKETWDRQSAIVNETFTTTVVYIVLALLLFIYLLCVCGKTKDGEHKAMWLDNIWAEIHLAAIAGVGIGAVVICAILLDEYLTGHFPYSLMNTVVVFSSAIASTVVLTSLLSIIRNIKCKRFVESSIIVRVIRWIRDGLIGYRNLMFRTLSKKTGIILISMLFVYTALIGMFGFLGYHEAIYIVVGVLLFFFGAFVVAYRAKDLDEIKKGVSQVRGGNVGYKIPELKSEDMKVLATNINDIAKGLDESVSAKVKAERLKTELITNVSHDLKTPITSIINYTELLSNMEELPEEAKDYVSVIAKKSERLKNLTQDLFDISKVQSGNEDVVLEKLDVVLLINQSLGEHDSEIQKSELPFCVDAPKELYILADGRKMSRVVSNLINNILKYSMKNTRVFITAMEKDGETVIEFKNIASYPMNFHAEEIVGRFVRGDESRTQEGNGLGLAIAKSYTEICNGKFEVIIDGDLFKVLIRFPMQ